MEWVEPVVVKSSVKYLSSLVAAEDVSTKNITNGSFPESDIAWFASGNQLDVVSTSHKGVQSRTFKCSQGQEFEVTCVSAIPNESLALVGLGASTGSGAVALYNYSTSMILNSWGISHKVSCICAMDITDSSYKQFLKSDCFLFAVGTEEGHVMLLAIDQHFKFSEGTHQLDLNIVHYLTTDDFLHNRSFFKPPVVLVIPLNDVMYQAGRFVLESMHESQTVMTKRTEEVCVTALKYVPQTKSICVGYNMQGAFQLFSLRTLDMDFSGFAQGCKNEQLGRVLDFSFLEPEDDPRHFCYLAVVAQITFGTLLSPYAVLYSLTYVNKDSSADGIILYDDLQHITLRLDMNFAPLIVGEDSAVAEGEIKLLSCQSLPSYASTASNSTRLSSSNGLCYLALHWMSNVYIMIFDLNQWYQAQMPSRWLFDDMANLCPFMGFYHVRVGNGSTRQVWIQPETLSIFHRSSVSAAEQFFYPSALSFRMVTVSPFQSESILFLGIQSLLLHKLGKSGSSVLSQPHRHYIQAVKAGLIPAGEVAMVAPNVPQMAEALLNIGLENNCRAFLISCIQDEGANLNFVEKWAWQQVLNLKAARENLCQILFDHSAQEMEQQMHGQLYHVTHQFNNLSVLYKVMDQRIRSLNSGVNEKLRDKARAIYLLNLHLETVLWFLHGGLLPESDDGDDQETGSLPYPRRQMEAFYQNRKSDIESLSSSVQAKEVLLIEQLVPSSVVELWDEERGCSGTTYPPPSLYALLSAYLRPDVDDVTKHRLVQYVFMDLAWIYQRQPHYDNILQHLVTFPSTYSLKPSMIKVTQAFWHLDHQNFDDALSMLLDPLVHTMDISNSQQRSILRSFLYQNQRKHALKYAMLRQPVCPELEDIQLHLTILVANALVGDALSYVRRNKNQRNDRELMQHLLCGCQEMRKISVLLSLPLSDEEEEHVTLFLKQSRNIDLQEALLLFYIQRCKYPDAIAYSQRLNQMWPARDAVTRERFNRRDMLMQTLIGALPPITCKLAEIANSKPSFSGVNFPRPLSVAVLPATSKVLYSESNFFKTVIEQSRATWLIEQKLHESQTPLKTRKRKIDAQEAPQMEPESTPFLCNIVQPSKRNVTLGVSLAFPSPKTPRAMDSPLVMDGEESQPKQGKRPRYSLFPRPIVPRNDMEVSSVLQTPPIHRTRRSEAVTGSYNRPASILKDKMNRFMNNSMFSSSQATVISDVHLSDEEAEVEVADTSAKHLRFALPQVISPSTSESEGMDTMDASDKDALKLGAEERREEFLSFVEDPDVDGSPVRDAPLSTTCYDMDITNVAPTSAHHSDDNISEAEQTIEEDEGAYLEALAELDKEPEADIEEVDAEAETRVDAPVKALVDADKVSQVDAAVEAQADADVEADANMDVDAQQGKQTEANDSDVSDIVCLDSSADEEQEEEELDEEDEDEEEVEEEQIDLPQPQQERLTEDAQRKKIDFDMAVEDDEEDVSDEDSAEEDVGDKSELPQSSVSFKQRFNVSSSEEYSTDDSFVQKDDSRPGISGYSKVESDFSSESEAEMAGGLANEDEPEVTSDVEAEKDQPSPATVYSKVESDFSSESEAEAEMADELPEKDESVVASDVEAENSAPAPALTGYSKMESDVEPEDSDASLSDSKKNDSESESEDGPLVVSMKPATAIPDEEDIQEGKEVEEGEEGEEEEEFELKFTETPTVSRRITRQRFSLSSAASSDDDTRHVKDVEASPVLLSRGENEEAHCSSSDDEADREPVDRSSNRTSIFKSRLQLSDINFSLDENVDDEDVAEDPEREKLVEDRPLEASRKEVSDSNLDQDDKAEDVEMPESEEPVEEKASEVGSEEASDSEMDQDEEAQSVDDELQPSGDIDNSIDIELEESSTCENDDLKSILDRHVVVDLPLPEGIIPMGKSELSTILEESAALGESKECTPIPEDEDEDEEEPEDEDADVEEPEVETEEHSDAETEPLELDENPEPISEDGPVSEDVVEPTMDGTVNALDAAVIDEDVFEAMGEEEKDEEEEEEMKLDVDEEDEEEAETEEKEKEVEEEVEEDPSTNTRSRGKSLRLSQVPLPFSSRRSVWDGGERDRSSPTSSMTSEPPPLLEEPVVKARRRRHSDAAVSSPAPRRSTRLSSSFVEEAPATPSTPSKMKLTRRSRLKINPEDLAGSPLPPSVDVSPTGSSAPGTPIRRSARIALREGTPEPSVMLPVQAEVLATSLGRIRRHSAGPSDTSALSSPMRRSGRKLNISRDNSPTDSVTSEPPPRTETTPSRKRPSRTLKSAHKSGALNLFPVDEESELLIGVKPLSRREEAPLADSDDSAVASPMRRSNRKLNTSRDVSPTDSVTSETESRRGRKPRTRVSKLVEAELPLLADTDPDSGSDNEQTEEKNAKKTRSQSSAGSVSSSPSSGRYNLRRARRHSELEIISEEAGSSHAPPADGPSAPKRRRNSQTEASDTTTPPTSESSSVKGAGKTRRKKKAEADPAAAASAAAASAEEEPSSDELRFVRRPKPPKNLPKRDPVIKSRSGPRRSMRMD